MASKQTTSIAQLLFDGIPVRLVPILEAAGIVRKFDIDVIQALTELEDPVLSRSVDELLAFPFVRSVSRGYVLHDTVHESIRAYMRAHGAAHLLALDEKACRYFGHHTGYISSSYFDDRFLEYLFHLIQIDEGAGISKFQERAEDFVVLHVSEPLRTLINDVSNYKDTIKGKGSLLWIKYYAGRLAQLDGHLVEAERTYRQVSGNKDADPKLCAYALCDLGTIVRVKYHHEYSVELFEKCFDTWPLDAKLASGLLELSGSLWRLGKTKRSLEVLEQAKDYYGGTNDTYRLVYVLNRGRGRILGTGFFPEAMEDHRIVSEKFATISPEAQFLKLELLSVWAIAWAWTGRVYETELNLRKALEIADKLALTENKVNYYQELAYVLGLQGKFDESEQYFEKGYDFIESKTSGIHHKALLAIIRGSQSKILLMKGELERAESYLLMSLKGKRSVGDDFGVLEVCNLLGELHELRYSPHMNSFPNELESAEDYYKQSVMVSNINRIDRPYFGAHALLGVARLAYQKGHGAEVEFLLEKVERKALRYEYNDCLAAVHLIRGHLMVRAGDGALANNNLAAAVEHYREALVYALRFNRFELDLILSRKSPLTAVGIIPFCLTFGAKGRIILETLLEWWRKGENKVRTPYGDIVSPIPPGLPLLEAEQLAREREPGAGEAQQTVTEQLSASLAE